MEKICQVEKCTGCFACLNACPRDAISVMEDEMGKTIPYIDQEKCIDCGICKKKCPQNSNSDFHNIKKCYAVKTKHEEDQVECASGGVATTFYRYFIEEQKGAAYGSAFGENLTLCQKESTSIEEIEQFRGSKYVQSYVDKTYQQVKQRLSEGKKVVYVGTPCQIDGLKNYLGKDDEKLLLVDIICHGVPPIKYLKEYAQTVCEAQQVDKATFRGKNNFMLCFYQKNQKIYEKKREYDYYFSAFADGYTYRDNCYQCKYAQKQRVSDITIGDFWGLNRATLKSELTGRISTVLLNTDKGKQYFDEMKHLFVFEEREIEEAVRGNAQLNVPVEMGKQTAKFRKAYLQKGFIDAVRKTDTGIKVMYRQSYPYKLLERVRDKIRNR